MAAAIGQYAANKFLKDSMKQYQSKQVAGDNDPYFALIPDPRHPGKTKKVKKQIPSYIPEHDAKILAKVRRRAYRWDMSLFDLFGQRFGWSSVIGIVPGFGDVADGLISLKLVSTCRGVSGGLPNDVLFQMLIFVAIDLIIGFVPLLGDIADAWFKANTRNVRVLEKYLDAKYKPKDLAALDKARAREHGGLGNAPATVYEDFDEAEKAHAGVAAGAGAGAGVGRTQPGSAQQQQLPPVKTGWMGWFGARKGQGDLEAGRQVPPQASVHNAYQETGTVVNSR